MHMAAQQLIGTVSSDSTKRKNCDSLALSRQTVVLKIINQQMVMHVSFAKAALAYADYSARFR